MVMPKSIKILITVIVIGILFICLLNLEAYRNMAWMCTQCRTLKYATHWRIGFVTSNRIEPSSLEKWMNAHSVIHKHN